MKKTALWVMVPLVLWSRPSQGDWPMLRGNAQRTGFIDAAPGPPFRVAWTRHFARERLGSAMEPAVSRGRLFVSTHQGSLYALDARSGAALWRFQAHGAFLQSPAVEKDIVVVHYGENFLDPPDFALDAFKAMAWLKGRPRADLASRLDLPFCRADLSYLVKLSLALEP